MAPPAAPRMTRDQWLYAITKEILPIFTEVGASFSTRIRIVSGIDDEKHWGKCFPTRYDNVTLILVSPKIKKPIDAAATVVHELVHAAVGCEHGHDETFRTLALRVGITDPAPNTTWWPDGPELIKRLTPLVERVGPYPKSAVIEIDRAGFAAHIGPQQVSETIQIDRASFAARGGSIPPPKPPPPRPKAAPLPPAPKKPKPVVVTGVPLSMLALAMTAREPKECRSLLIEAEWQHQENLARIVEQRRIRWIREHVPDDDDRDYEFDIPRLKPGPLPRI